MVYKELPANPLVTIGDLQEAARKSGCTLVVTIEPPDNGKPFPKACRRECCATPIGNPHLPTCPTEQSKVMASSVIPRGLCKDYDGTLMDFELFGGKFRIKPKRDLPAGGWYDSETRTMRRDGFVVTNGGMLNVMPGAVWFRSIAEAHAAIVRLIQCGGDADAFHGITHGPGCGCFYGICTKQPRAFAGIPADLVGVFDHFAELS